MIALSVLGGVRLSGADPERLSVLLAQPKRVALLVYLALARPRGYHNRDTLLALFWPEQDDQHARWALNQAVHHLRRALGQRVVLRRGDDVLLDVEWVGCDAIALERAHAAHRWDEVLRLYQGELLPGLRPGGAVELEHWIDGERERLRRLAAEAANSRTEELVVDGDFPAAVQMAREAMRLAPDEETRVRRLIELLCARGDRAGASQTYREYAAWLKQERELEPAPETRALLETVQRVSAVPAARTASSGPQSSRRGIRRVIALATVIALLGSVVLVLQRAASMPPAIIATDLTQVTAEPGVEYQPAISSDGKVVAYLVGPILSSHVVMRSTENTPGGGEVRPADAVFTDEWSPMWSPEGDRLRFFGCHVHLAEDCAWYETGRLGGSVRPALPSHAKASVGRVVSGSINLAWSPDGDRLVYASHDTLYISSTNDTGAPRPIVVQAPQIARPPHSLAWSPDEKLIAYEVGNTGWAEIGNLDEGSIWVVSSDGGTPRQVTRSDHLNAYPVWMDNRHLLFVSDRNGARSLYVVDVGPDGARSVPRLIPGVADPHSISYAISPQRLAWAKYTQRQNIWSYPLPVPGKAPASIRDGIPATTSNQVVELLDVSRDGRWLVFDSNRRGNQDLYLLSLTGGALVPLTDAPWDEASPRFSPDGNFIAFHGAHRVDSTMASVMSVQTDGGTPEVLTNAPGWNTYPAWSLDGLHLAFSSTRTGRGRVWLMSRDSLGGAWHDALQLSDTYAQVHDWAPNGRGVLIGDLKKLALVSTQGTVLWTRDLFASGLDAHDWGRFSRDGSVVYVTGHHRDGRKGVWAIPMGDGPPRLVITSDDPALGFEGGIAVGRDRLYLTVSQYESDIWTAKLTW